MSRNLFGLILALFLTGALVTGCGVISSPAGGPAKGPAVAATAKSSANKQEKEYKNIAGLYVGQADSNFIEIKNDSGTNFPESGKYAVFLVPEGIRGVLDELNSNDRVTFDCFRNNQHQWELTRLVKSPAGS